MTSKKIDGTTTHTPLLHWCVLISVHPQKRGNQTTCLCRMKTLNNVRINGQTPLSVFLQNYHNRPPGDRTELDWESLTAPHSTLFRPLVTWGRTRDRWVSVTETGARQILPPLRKGAVESPPSLANRRNRCVFKIALVDTPTPTAMYLLYKQLCALCTYDNTGVGRPGVSFMFSEVCLVDVRCCYFCWHRVCRKAGALCLAHTELAWSTCCAGSLWCC